MTYPDPDINEPLDIFSYVNTITDGWAVPLFLLALGTIIFVLTYYKNYKISSCFVMATTGSFIFGSLFWAGGLLTGKIVVFILALDILTFIWAKFDD